MSGVRVHFVLGGGGQVTSARLSEELGQLERTHQQRYAPHGLHLMRILHEAPSTHIPGPPSYCQLYFRPVRVQQEDIMVITPPDHPFYVHGKGVLVERRASINVVNIFVCCKVNELPYRSKYAFSHEYK